MEIFQSLTELSYGELHLLHDPASGLKAAVAIHSTRLGPALGGARFVPYASDTEAIRDALRLARGMTYKAALAGLALGGGKAVLIRQRDLDESTRRAQLLAFGRFVDSLGGRYITAEDSGTSLADMNLIREVTRYVSGTSATGGDPSPYTALGVRRGVEAAAKFAFSKDDLRGLRVAIQGVGNVGAHLARDLAGRGCRLVLSDINQERAQKLAAELGAKVVPSAEIFDVEADIFAPCALGGALTLETVPRLRVAAVAGAANNQLAVPAAADLLVERGILYSPDYAINAGGLIHVAREWAGLSAEEVDKRCQRIYDTLLEIYTIAKREGKSPAVIADAKAEEALQKNAR